VLGYFSSGKKQNKRVTLQLTKMIRFNAESMRIKAFDRRKKYLMNYTTADAFALLGWTLY